MTNYKRGDIVLILFPDSNLHTAKKRPALIVAMATSNMKRAGHQSRVMVLLNSNEGRQSGLQSDSVIVTDNLATIQEKFIDKVLGNFPAMDKVESALANTFGLKLL